VASGNHLSPVGSPLIIECKLRTRVLIVGWSTAARPRTSCPGHQGLSLMAWAGDALFEPSRLRLVDPDDSVDQG